MISLAKPTHSGPAKDFKIGATITGYETEYGFFRGFRMKPAVIEVDYDSLTFICRASRNHPAIEVTFRANAVIEWTVE